MMSSFCIKKIINNNFSSIIFYRYLFMCLIILFIFIFFEKKKINSLHLNKNEFLLLVLSSIFAIIATYIILYSMSLFNNK